MVLYNQKPMLESIDEASCLSVDLINFRSDFMYAVHLSAVVLGYGLFYSNKAESSYIFAKSRLISR